MKRIHNVKYYNHIDYAEHIATITDKKYAYYCKTNIDLDTLCKISYAYIFYKTVPNYMNYFKITNIIDLKRKEVKILCSSYYQNILKSHEIINKENECLI